MNFIKLSDILPGVLAKREMAGVGREEEVKHVCEEWLKGKLEGGQVVRVGGVKNGVLWLGVRDAVWGQKVQLWSGELKKELEKRCPGSVKSIRIRVDNFF